MSDILILTEHYPSEENIYNYMFVHSRVKEYTLLGHTVKVLFLSKKETLSYVYEGVEVFKGCFGDYKNDLLLFNPDVIFTHSPKKLIIQSIVDIKSVFNIPNFTWIHGVEALSVYRRTFNICGFQDFFKIITKGVLIEINRIILFRRYVKVVESYNDKFIFVSDWMKKITEFDNFSKINNFSIIPNFIDTNSFAGIPKRNRKSLLIVRSFETRKYANDISIDIVNKLNELRQDFELTIYGDGKLFDKEVSKLRLLGQRLTVNKKMLNRDKLKDVLSNDKFGFFLCPTRQDAQGVTMCEGMSAGLVIVTNPSTAIPEFVKEGYAVIDDRVCNIVEQISNLMDDVDSFNEKSINAMRYVRNTLSSNILVTKELSLIHED